MVVRVSLPNSYFDEISLQFLGGATLITICGLMDAAEFSDEDEECLEDVIASNTAEKLSPEVEFGNVEYKVAAFYCYYELTRCSGS